METLGKFAQGASTSLLRLLKDIGIVELEDPPVEKRIKRSRDFQELDPDMEPRTTEKRHKSYPAEKRSPRRSPGSSLSPESFRILQNGRFSVSPWEGPTQYTPAEIDPITFETIYLSPTRVRNCFSRLNIDNHGAHPSNGTHFPLTPSSLSSQKRKRSFSSPNSAFMPTTPAHGTVNPPSHRSPSSSSNSNQFRTFDDIFRHVERVRAKRLASPLVTTATASSSNATPNQRADGGFSSKSSYPKSPTALVVPIPINSPEKEIPSSKSPVEFSYFTRPDDSKRASRPRWIAKEEVDTANYRLQHAEENAKKLREMAKKEREAQREAFEAYRSPPVTVARVPVPWPDEAEWEEMEARVRYGNEEETLVIQTGGEQCSRRDLRFLLDLEWLNDVCINAYVHLLRQRAKKAMETEKSWPKTFLFGSFLLDTLCNGRQGYNYTAVRRVTTRAKVDVFALDKILIPFHLGNHWTMACINFNLKRFEYYDSLGGLSMSCIQALQRWLNDEFIDKKGNPAGFDTSKWTIFHPKNIPHQHNGSDCGAFALTYADYLSRNKPFDFTQADMPAIRARIITNILKNEPLALDD